MLTNFTYHSGKRKVKYSYVVVGRNIHGSKKLIMAYAR